MKLAAALCRAGDRIVSFIAAVVIFTSLAFGGYSLWDMWSTAHGAFIGGELLKYKPGTVEEDPEALSLWDLYELNPDVCGWLTVPDTHIDYPVVRGENDSIYLNMDVFGDFSLAGSIFMSCENAADFSDAYTVLYGHHITGGAMFADVIEFQNTAYFESHPTGELILLNGRYTLEFFACAPADAYDRVLYRDLTAYNDSENGVAELLAYIRDIAVQYRDIGLTGDDRIVAMSTCTSAATNGRIILFGRLAAA